MVNNNDYITLSALKITLIYVFVAGLWILFTDHLLKYLVSETGFFSTSQIFKEWFFVFLTGGGLYWMIKYHDRQLISKEQKLTNLQDELHSQTELKDIFFERIPVMITIYDPELKEFHVNKEFEKVTGWSNEQIEARNISLIEECYPDLEQREKVLDFLNTPGVGWKEFTMTAQSGEQVPTSWTNVRLTDNTSVGIGIDMTEIKASQVKIRESQKLLKKTFESLRSGLILINPEDRTIIDCNKGTEELFGYDREELIGSSTEKLHVNEEKYKEFDEMGTEALAEKGVFQTEFKMQKNDGTVFHSDHTVTIVTDKEGEVDKIVSVIRDITDQKKSQKELEKRNQFIETTLENLPIGVAVNTLDKGKITLMNQKFTEIYGWPEEVLTDINSFFEKVYPNGKYRKKIKQQVVEEIKSGNPERISWKGIPITTQEGDRKYVNNKIIPIYEQDLMISTVIDVTEQRNLEKKLRESEKKYRHIFEDNPVPMWIYKPSTLEFMEVNQAAINHYGYTKEEFLNMTLTDIRPPEDVEELENTMEKHRSQESYIGEWRHLKKDGTLINVEVSAANVQYKDETYRLALIHDITEQKRIQEKIIQSVLEGEDRERKRVAHELHDGLGQYLTAANMNFETVKKDIGELSEKRQRQFSTGLSHLKNALHETRSIAYNLMPKTIADYGLVTALENMILDFDKGTEIDFHFDHNCGNLQLKNQAEINIYRIFQEITSNAVQHSECSAIKAKLELKDNTLKIQLKDNGIGTRIDDQDEEKGLGLRSIKTRVNSLKGDMNIESQPGEGMETTIVIPEINNLITDNSSDG